MTAPTEKTLNYGLRRAQVLLLTDTNYPAATSVTPYEGLQIQGSTAFDLTIPDARKLTGLGEDGITQVVFLPPQEGASGVLNAEAADPVLAAMLDGTLVSSAGEASLVGVGTNQQGFEPQVGLVLYQAARGLVTGGTFWHTYFLPSAQVVRKAGPMNADKSPTVYQVAPNRVSAHLWGTAFAAITEGFTSAQIVEAWSTNPLRVTAFLGTGTEDEFSFPADVPSLNATPVVWVAGVKKTITTDYTATTAKITFGVGKEPALNAVVVVLREVAG